MVAAKAKRAAVVAAILWSPCFAHHGVAPHYDDERQVRIEGVVARFEFINPHSFVYVEVDDGGTQQIWRCELASRSVLSRNGLTADTFAPGQAVTIEGSAARVNPTGCAVRTAWLADGSILRSTELFAPTLASPADAPADPQSIFGTWTMKRFSVSRYSGQLTAAGERAREAFDPIEDDPAIYCDPASPVRFWVNVNEPFRIRREADTVLLEHRFMDHVRRVHLDVAMPPADEPRSAMGYSTGRFEGAALIISTSHFTAAPLEPRYGVMHTEDLRLTERLEVDERNGDLTITWVIDDPAYFVEPVTQTERFVRSPWDPVPYACEPGYQQ
jgi:hypothetical protein